MSQWPRPLVLERASFVSTPQAGRGRKNRMRYTSPARLPTSHVKQPIRSHNRHCEQSEAIHRATQRKNGLLCFARNDGKLQVRDLAAGFARGLACSFRPRKTEGAGNAGRPMRPIAARAMVAIERTRDSQVTPEIARHSPRDGFTVSFALSLVTGLSCHHRPRSLPANLTPASGRQDHTTSPSASSALRPKAHQRPPHPAPRS